MSKTRVAEKEKVVPSSAEVAGHPYAFGVSGPHNFSSPNWRDLIHSSWMDPNYKRMVIACFVQAAYLLELDRQEQRTEENGLSSKWWIPFMYKLIETLVDERDGSIYGAILKWDRAAAFSHLLVKRPIGAPKVVLALRGTMLNKPSIKRDLQDDLRFFAMENLRGSVRFAGALEAVKLVAKRHGGSNVCIAGHSLGAAFALQVGKELAKEGVFLECHLFNPPSVSVKMAMKVLREQAGFFCNGTIDESHETVPEASTRGGGGTKQWVPHLYVNTNDYIGFQYGRTAADGDGKMKNSGVEMVTKLFLVSKGPKNFLQAHGLPQWWSDNLEAHGPPQWWSNDLELQQAISRSEHLTTELRSLYAATSRQLLPRSH